MNEEPKKLPPTPAAFLSGAAGVQPQMKPEPVREEVGAISRNKALEMNRKVKALRLQKALQEMHWVACDVSEKEEIRLDAARALATALNNHFDIVVWALRVAGGARRP